MKILVTGAGGFIGSHLCEELVKQGHNVRALIHYNSRNNWGWLESSPFISNMEIVSGNVRDYDSVKKCLKEVDLVFHLAALIGIPYSYVSPLAYIKTNLEGTYNICQAAAELDTKKVVITSTSEVYGTARYVPIDEDHPLQAQSPYSATKIAADQLGLSYYRSFGLPISIVRPFNTYGPRQSTRAIIPTIITQILGEEKAVRLGSLTPTRDLNFVRNTVKGMISVGFSEKCTGEIVNLGSGSEISIGDLVKLIEKISGIKTEIEIDPPRIRPEASEVERLLCDNKKAFALTGWKPQLTLEEGLRTTIEWFAQNTRQYKSGLYTV
ncbi:MAG TPA: NAD-dependent dehydratase [Desulfotomaculum sp.]|nr:MAG: NAD-dependent epimerase/dehydratase [Desulfotomaculum sp. 46_80]HAG11528.1 NAD-dependent dehydratase [Desulfotomaculum sp.]HBY03768.1 NAD-dependent dehydratase [Desulfotomaculum sp.]